MAITVTPDMTEVSLCEDTTNWSDGAINDIFQKQGLYCLGLKVSATESALVTYTFGSPVDMSNGEHIYFWTLITGKPDTKVNGGIRLYVETDANNFGYFNVGGNDNYPGGWVCWCIDPGATPTSGTGTINTASIAKVGVRFKTLTTSLGNNANCFWDAVRYGKGLKITSGPSDAVDLEDIFLDDDNSSNCYGVIGKINNVYFVQGQLVFGDTSSGDIDFKDTNQLVVFKDNEFVNASFYEVKVQGNASGTINFQLGNQSGTAGIQGCILKSAGTKTFGFTATDANIDVLKIYGSSFLNAGTVSLPANAAGREVLNTTFDACGEVLADTCVVKYCNFIYADDRGLRMSSTSHNSTDCNFINCPDAIHIPTADTYDLTNMVFSNCTYDIENSSAGAVTVDNLGTSNATTYENTGGGSTTINSAVSLEINGVKSLCEQFTHGAVSGGDGVFKVGYYLRGLTSGAVGFINEAVDGTHTICRTISGTFSATETVNETIDGTAGGDSGEDG